MTFPNCLRIRIIPIIALILIAGCGPSWARETKSIVEIASQVDWSCMQLRVLGPCPTPKPPYEGVRYQYWEPAFLMESVKAPGDYVIREIGMPLRGALSSLNQNKTSTSSYQSLGDSNLQFNEVHLYDFPLKMFMQTVMCPSTLGDGLVIRYLSELNSDHWRKGALEPPLSAVMLGSWGPLYPRVGFLVHSSPLVASAATCTRAINLIGAGPDIIKDKVQMVYPSKGRCVPIGSNMADYDSYQSRDGRYVFIYWRYRECCRTISG